MTDKNKVNIIAKLSSSEKLTENVLNNLSNYLDDPELWHHWILKYEIGHVRPLVVEQAVYEIEIIQTLRTVAECCRYQINPGIPPTEGRNTMSCYIMNHDGIRKMGYTIAECLNRGVYGNDCTIATIAAQCSDLGRAFMDGFCFMDGRFQGEGIARALHLINAQAYAERYRESDLELFSAPESRRKYSIWELAERIDGNEISLDWHYALVVLIDCWLYQTDEGIAAIADKRLAVQKFRDMLTLQIVQHSDGYRKARSSF